MKNVNEQIHYTGQYLANKSIYSDYRKSRHKEKFYDDLTFHRIIDGFMIQGGDPEGNGTGGTSIWDHPFEDEFSQELFNLRGALSMANSGPNY